jgi:hypothetical protein
MSQERVRLSESAARSKHWERWGPYLSERAWGTVREDYGPYGGLGHIGEIFRRRLPAPALRMHRAGVERE